MTKQQAQSLAKALKGKFGGKADFEAINGHGRYRFTVTSAKFNKVPHLARQDEVWKVIDRVLPREATIDVSMVLAYAPADLAAIA